MYVIVQCGKDEKHVMNANCRCLFLLEALRRKGDCAEDVEIDVCDEQGNVKLLRENLDRYASELLAERERLVLLKVDRNDSGASSYTPLLDSQQIVTDAFMARLQSRSVVTAKNGRGQRVRANVVQAAANGGGAMGSKRTVNSSRVLTAAASVSPPESKQQQQPTTTTTKTTKNG
jgi:hypothetical protein